MDEVNQLLGGLADALRALAAQFTSIWLPIQLSVLLLAAMIAAGQRLRQRGVHDFAFLLVVGEETDSIGAKSANVAFANLGSEYVLVGEPTESKFVRAAKGVLSCTLHFEGIAAHSAYPERGDSAINKMVRAIEAINGTDWGSHDVVSRFGGRITIARGSAPQFMFVPEGKPSTIVAFGSDVPYLGNLGKPLLFGPGSILDAHGANERIAKRELIAAIDVYCDTVVELLK